jgi:hypothetical protein
MVWAQMAQEGDRPAEFVRFAYPAHGLCPAEGGERFRLVESGKKRFAAALIAGESEGPGQTALMLTRSATRPTARAHTRPSMPAFEVA